MKQARSLDCQREVRREEHKPRVDEVEHAVGGIDLSSELSDVDGDEDHRDAISEEDLRSCGVGSSKAKDVSIRYRCSAKVDHEDEKDDEELTSNDEALHVVPVVGDRGTSVADGVRVDIIILVSGLETDEASLTTFNHGEPDDAQPEHDDRSSRRNAV